MPLYEYQCDECGHTFEKIQKFSDPLETECPKCGGKLRKLMSSPAIQFKGSGFYITDYAKKDSTSTKFDSSKSPSSKSDSGKSDAKSESSGAAAGGESSSSSETKSDSKAETKSEPAKTTKPA